MTDDEASDLAEKAEKEIQKILLNLEEQTGRRIYSIHIDLRNYANRSASVVFEE